MPPVSLASQTSLMIQLMDYHQSRLSLLNRGKCLEDHALAKWWFVLFKRTKYSIAQIPAGIWQESRL